MDARNLLNGELIKDPFLDQNDQMKKGHAYEVDGTVYFKTRSFKDGRKKRKIGF